MKLLLMASMVLAGCMQARYTDVTDNTRALSEPVTRTYDKRGEGELVEFRTPPEADGYAFVRDSMTDENGKVEVSLLPAALQCLAYGHEVRLAVWSYSKGREIHAEMINADRARAVLEQVFAQVTLGGKVPMRQAERALLQRARASIRDATMQGWLEAIEQAVENLPDWR